ncbi:hypothetical protein EIP91_000675 [Steccherinum ochraceum]|uniref:THO complex subunit 5 n=1 Tax=Steccherinum ochraceum TaxID=92696 RepID=A0A4R0RLX1_9APHY|nr:hypothetical protein EIP91_000675 [Steccherinum ochraceum]
MPLVDPPSALPPAPELVVDKLRDLVSSSYLNHDASTIHIRAGALFARLKALNRNANASTRSHKQTTADARHDMDQTHLGLQNFQYEKRHLEREIEKCRQFASIYQDIPLYTLDEFLERAPEDLRTPAILADDLANEHALMLSRLSFELLERQRLEQRQKELQQQKEDLLRQSKAQAATMDNVKSQIDNLVKTATDVQKKISDLAESMPTPSPAS